MGGRGIFGWDLPPGCSVSDIPGNRPEDEAYEKMMDDFYAKLSKEEQEKAEPLVDIIAKAINYGIDIGMEQAKDIEEENKFYEEQAKEYRKEHPEVKEV